MTRNGQNSRPAETDPYGCLCVTKQLAHHIKIPVNLTVNLNIQLSISNCQIFLYYEHPRAVLLGVVRSEVQPRDNVNPLFVVLVGDVDSGKSKKSTGIPHLS